MHPNKFFIIQLHVFKTHVLRFLSNIFSLGGKKFIRTDLLIPKEIKPFDETFYSSKNKLADPLLIYESFVFKHLCRRYEKQFA